MLTFCWHLGWHLPTSKLVSWYVNVPLPHSLLVQLLSCVWSRVTYCISIGKCFITHFTCVFSYDSSGSLNHWILYPKQHICKAFHLCGITYDSLECYFIEFLITLLTFMVFFFGMCSHMNFNVACTSCTQCIFNAFLLYVL